MDDLLIATHTRRQLAALQADPPQGVLFVGATGQGKRAVAVAWAATITTPANICVVEPDEKGTISIETIRGLYKRTRNRRSERQVVIIDGAQTLSIEAQNAFLKLLEEPNPSVTFILTTPTAEALLPTITSRVQTVSLPRLASAVLQAYAHTKVPQLPAQDLAQLLFVADGRAGTFARLLQDPAAFDAHRAVMQRAKLILTATQYERLALINDLAKDKPLLIETLEAVAHMLYTQIMRAPEPRWLRMASGLEQCLLRLGQNGNPRAQLTALFTAY